MRKNAFASGHSQEGERAEWNDWGRRILEKKDNLESSGRLCSRACAPVLLVFLGRADIARRPV